jgi:hypothetical protein
LHFRYLVITSSQSNDAPRWPPLGTAEEYARAFEVMLAQRRPIEAFLREHTRGSRNLGSAIWSLLMFELWCREVLD